MSSSWISGFSIGLVAGIKIMFLIYMIIVAKPEKKRD
jgi:hypothetical protein